MALGAFLQAGEIVKALDQVSILCRTVLNLGVPAHYLPNVPTS